MDAECINIASRCDWTKQDEATFLVVNLRREEGAPIVFACSVFSVREAFGFQAIVEVCLPPKSLSLKLCLIGDWIIFRHN